MGEPNWQRIEVRNLMEEKAAALPPITPRGLVEVRRLAAGNAGTFLADNALAEFSGYFMRATLGRSLEAAEFSEETRYRGVTAAAGMTALRLRFAASQTEWPADKIVTPNIVRHYMDGWFDTCELPEERVLYHRQTPRQYFTDDKNW